MKKEDLIKGKKYKSSEGEILTFEKFGGFTGKPIFINEKKDSIAWDLKDALENLTPIEDPEIEETEKDLNLSVGESVYLGREEWVCERVNNSNMKYLLHNKKNTAYDLWIYPDGSIFKGLAPIFSREPYDLSEMVYEKRIQIGEMVFAWNDDGQVEENQTIFYGKYKGIIYKGIITNNKNKHIVGNGWFNFISKTPPF